jgi:glutamyl-tRNA synthetase
MISPPTTRLAPSPTGALHLGNARTFLVNWLVARQNGWKILMRIDDLDGPRIKRDADRQAMDDLRWLGLDWDADPIYQSSRVERYADAIARLLSSGRAYPCVCSRKEVESAASAPHSEDGSTVYPGTCRGKFSSIEEARASSEREPAIRFAVPEGIIEFDDAFAGRQTFDVARQLGDFVIRKADGTAAYQLAVVVDDAEMGVTQIVRGDDLLDSTPRQILLYRALGLVDRIPNYLHLPLVVGEDGRRLAKRHGDTRIAFYREAGVTPESLRSLLAKWCGITARPEATLQELRQNFRLESLPRERIVFTIDDERTMMRAK